MAGILHVQDEKTTGTDGGSASAATVHTRTLNTTVLNTITGASLSANQVTLSAGLYDFIGICPAWDCDRHRAYIYNVTDAAIAILGPSGHLLGSGDSHGNTCYVRGRLSIPSPKVFELRHYVQTARATNGLGIASDDGETEVYGQLFVKDAAAASAGDGGGVAGEAYRSLLLDI